MTAEETQSNTANGISGMSQIGAVIVVLSCKGGVGKSSTAANLAFALRSLGASVGIFDSDFYGPSLPTMITPSDDKELSFVDVERGIEMFDTVNVPCVAVVENMAYIETESKQKSPGIDTNKLFENFIQKLQDNDIKLAEGKSLENLSLDLVDVVSQQQSLKSDQKTEKEQIRFFSPGHKQCLSNQWGIEHTFSVPLLQNIASNGDSGTPYILEFPESCQAKTYKELGECLGKRYFSICYSDVLSYRWISE